MANTPVSGIPQQNPNTPQIKQSWQQHLKKIKRIVKPPPHIEKRKLRGNYKMTFSSITSGVTGTGVGVGSVVFV